MFAMREYPADVLPLYSQGYSAIRYDRQALARVYQLALRHPAPAARGA